jgi:glycerol-3-phosphate dehydrogenase (NAD(P)+)
MRFAVVGGGAWGSALGIHLIRCGHTLRVWAREDDVISSIRERRRNERFLPEVELPEGFEVTPRLDEATEGAEVVLVVIPSQFCRGIYAELATIVSEGTILVSATKGIEIDSLKRMTEVAAEEAPRQPIAVLSGPSFALEVARGHPTTVVVASAQQSVAESLQKALSRRRFRVYRSSDVVGVELGGALKNIIAIAAGIIDGLGYGYNTTAALLTRGLAEISRLAVALGGRADTLAGLAGMGDLVLTCTGGLSRNRRLGQALGQGKSMAEAMASVSVAEGVRTTLAACDLAERAGVEMPISAQMRAVLHQGKQPGEAVDELMSRSLKRE